MRQLHRNFGEKNVSSKWTSFEKDEDLAKINEFTSYLD